MKKVVLTITALVLLASCKNEPQPQKEVKEVATEELAPVSNDLMETAVIYEANIRQYSEEGTFDAFTEDRRKVISMSRTLKIRKKERNTWAAIMQWLITPQ